MSFDCVGKEIDTNFKRCIFNLVGKKMDTNFKIYVLVVVVVNRKINAYITSENI